MAKRAAGERRHALASTPERHTREVREKRNVCRPGILGGAGPLPVLGEFHEPAPHGIGMNVVDGSVDRRIANEIPVVPTATLPEAILNTPARPFISHAYRDMRCRFGYEPVGFPGDGSFDCQENLGDLRFRFSRKDDQVHVLGHNDVRPCLKAQFPSRHFECVEKPPASAVAPKKRLTSITTERECVSFTRVVVSLAALSLPLPRRWGFERRSASAFDLPVQQDRPCLYSTWRRPLLRAWPCHPLSPIHAFKPTMGHVAATAAPGDLAALPFTACHGHAPSSGAMAKRAAGERRHAFGAPSRYTSHPSAHQNHPKAPHAIGHCC